MITGYIEDKSFASTYNISSFVSGLAGGEQKPVIAFIRNSIDSDYTSAEIDSNNVVLTSVDADKYYFEAFATGTLAVFAKDYEWFCPGFDNCAGICPGREGFSDWDFDCSGKKQNLLTLVQETAPLSIPSFTRKVIYVGCVMGRMHVLIVMVLLMAL
jgi:hypothetical protein